MCVCVCVCIRALKFLMTSSIQESVFKTPKYFSEFSM